MMMVYECLNYFPGRFLVVHCSFSFTLLLSFSLVLEAFDAVSSSTILALSSSISPLEP